MQQCIERGVVLDEPAPAECRRIGGQGDGDQWMVLERRVAIGGSVCIPAAKTPGIGGQRSQAKWVESR